MPLQCDNVTSTVGVFLKAMVSNLYNLHYNLM